VAVTVQRAGPVIDAPDSLQLRFDQGYIWFGDQRMVLLNTSALAALRKELVDTLGMDRTRGLLTRMGYASGMHDAKAARRAMPEASVLDLLEMGPRLHTVEGVVKVTRLRLEADIDRGHYHGDFIWESSFEDELHRNLFGSSADPVCWSQVGYACGFATAMMEGTFILFRETECKGKGDARCRIVGKPASAWDDPERVAAEMRYFQPESVAEQLIQLQTQVDQLRSSLSERATLGDMVGNSPAFGKACDLVRRAAASQVTVLLLGETGVGKEMFAQGLHAVSSRADGPFVAINCAAMPESLIESELFGVEKGAYTGAQTSRPGRFERADGGTLFLDEVGELSLAAQAKLLRVLQRGEVDRVGDSRTRKVDVRVVAATNVDLQQAVKAGRFRADLFYRLNVFPVHIPPLRERREDIPLLVEHFLEKHAVRHDRRIRGVTAEALNALQTYAWPGNIRELENVIERGVILAPNNGTVDVGDLFPYSPYLAVHGETDALEQLIGRFLDDRIPLEQLEQQLLETAVVRSDGNLSAAARLLGMTRPQLAYRLKKQG
jgi:transcriptional regulator with GAF, ATPase, and Fis domain